MSQANTAHEELCKCGALVDRSLRHVCDVPAPDPVHHPAHYTQHPSGIECITVTEHMTFCLGNAVKYVWRAGLKSNDPVQDLEKARWYIDREIERLRK